MRQYWHPTWARLVRYTRDAEYAEALAETLDRATEARLRRPAPGVPSGVDVLLSAGWTARPSRQAPRLRWPGKAGA